MRRLPLLLALALAGCGSSTTATQGASPAAVAQATPEARTVVAPGNADKGKATYEGLCLACHQADGKGLNGTLAANFVDDPSRLAKSDEALLDSIANGVDGTTMIAWEGQLNDAQMRDVLAYIRREFGKQ